LTGKRAPYKRKIMDTRGEQPGESRIQKSFWAEYSMDQVITMTSEELDKTIDSYMEAYIQRQIKVNKHWNFPESPKDNFAKIRNKKTNAKFN